jgi:hypothetical protein
MVLLFELLRDIPSTMLFEALFSIISLLSDELRVIPLYLFEFAVLPLIVLFLE